MSHACPLNDAIAACSDELDSTIRQELQQSKIYPSDDAIATICSILEIWETRAAAAVTAITADRMYSHAPIEEDWKEVKARILALAATTLRTKKEDVSGSKLGTGSNASSCQGQQRAGVAGKGSATSQRRASSDNYGTYSVDLDALLEEHENDPNRPVTRESPQKPPSSHHHTASSASGHDQHKSSIITAQQFWNTMEQYLRPLQDADIRLLDCEPDDSSLYTIPPLGSHYSRSWLGDDGVDPDSVKPETDPNDTFTTVQSYTDLSEDQMSSNPDFACLLQLTSRFVSLYLPDPTDIRYVEDHSPKLKGKGQFALYPQVDASLKSIVRSLGIDFPEDPDWSVREDDEVCARLRRLQSELRKLVSSNQHWKDQLRKIATNHMALQEYEAMLEHREKTIVQLYSKKTKNTTSSKKRKSATSLPCVTAEQDALRTEIKLRKVWMDLFIPLMKLPQFQWPPPP